MKKILLHICCGPCSITTVEALQEAGFEVTGLFYNPNIHPLDEYIRRKEGAMEVASRMNFTLLGLDDKENYRPEEFFRMVTFKGKNRCLFCYKLRLQKLFEEALKGAYTHFSTSLLYSKYQRHESIKVIAASLIPKESDVKFYYDDFRRGWGRGIKLSKKWGIYRQQYCGCLYSEIERYQQK